MTSQIDDPYYNDVDGAGRLTTSSKTGTFYFAYGSNLSPVQMSIRLSHSPSSSVPVAIARLDNHSWIICKRGYANVVSLARQSSRRRSESRNHLDDVRTSVPAGESPDLDDNSVVWGVLYNMHPVDETRLDTYEGHNEARNPNPEPNRDGKTKHVKSHLQGGWDYNKHYLTVTIDKWLVSDPNDYLGVDVERTTTPGSTTNTTTATTTVKALVYVDEFRTEPGQIVHEYIGRMNRGIQESVALGLPESWVQNVMRKFIPSGIHVDDSSYVGTDQGYVDDDDDDDQQG